jgi:hypothetical protein
MYSPGHPARHDLWADIKAASLGSRQNSPPRSISRAVLVLAVPMVIEMLGQSVFGVVDAPFVGRQGAPSLAAVGLAESLLVIVFAVPLGLAMATTAYIARRIGEGSVTEAGRGASRLPPGPLPGFRGRRASPGPSPRPRAASRWSGWWHSAAAA